MKTRFKAVVSFGSNIEPRRKYIEKALSAVSAFPETALSAASDIEETDPVGVPEEFSGMKFLNLLAIFETSLEPREFSRMMHETEERLGRVRTVKNGPRTIDIDLIDFNGITLSEPDLVLPHPRAHEREFIMRPWKKLVRSSGATIR